MTSLRRKRIKWRKWAQRHPNKYELWELKFMTRRIEGLGKKMAAYSVNLYRKDNYLIANVPKGGFASAGQVIDTPIPFNDRD